MRRTCSKGTVFKGLLLITLLLSAFGFSFTLYRVQDTVVTWFHPIETVEKHAQIVNTMDNDNHAHIYNTIDNENHAQVANIESVQNHAQVANIESVQNHAKVANDMDGSKRVNLSSTEHEKGQDKGIDILLNSYMRSGSSFIGKVLGWRKDTFYTYEPLHEMHKWQYFSGKKLCQYNSPLCHEDAGSASLNNSLSLLENLFRCNLQTIYNELVFYLIPKYGGQSWEVYRDCIKTRGTKQAMQCYLLETETCLRAKHRVAKLLRMDLDIAASLLRKNPRLKIVQLFRDPRAVINSHIKTKWYPEHLNNPQTIVSDAMVTCSRMENDINAYKTLMKQYPTRVIAVQYEDFDDLVLKSKLLFRFLDKDFPENNSTMALSFSASPFGYRDTLPWSVVQIVDTHCENVYRELGLVKFNTELELRDKTISPILGNLTFALLLNNRISA